MYKIVFVLLGIAALAHAGYDLHNAMENDRFREEMDERYSGYKSFAVGDNLFYMEESASYEAELRLYGLNPSPRGDWFALPHYFFLAVPADERYARIFSEQLCERASFEQASMIPVIAKDDAVLDILEELEEVKEETDNGSGRFCVRIQATTLERRKFFWKREDQTDTLTFHPGKFSEDPNKYMHLAGIEVIDCPE